MFKDKVAVVTGGAQGIGRCLSRWRHDPSDDLSWGQWLEIGIITLQLKKIITALTAMLMQSIIPATAQEVNDFDIPITALVRYLKNQVLSLISSFHSKTTKPNSQF